MSLSSDVIERLPRVEGLLNYLAPMAEKPMNLTYDPPPGVPRSTGIPEWIDRVRENRGERLPGGAAAISPAKPPSPKSSSQRTRRSAGEPRLPRIAPVGVTRVSIAFAIFLTGDAAHETRIDAPGRAMVRRAKNVRQITPSHSLETRRTALGQRRR
jgi:hypothetical protein